MNLLKNNGFFDRSMVNECTVIYVMGGRIIFLLIQSFSIRKIMFKLHYHFFKIKSIILVYQFFQQKFLDCFDKTCWCKTL